VSGETQRPPDRALDLFLDHAKHRVAVDPAELATLLGTAHVVIESSSPAPLQPLARQAPGRVSVRISPLGRGGPDDGHWSSELTDQARSGHLLLNGDPDREPITGPAHQVSFAAGIHGFIGAVAALAGGRQAAGCLVEVDHLHVMASLHQFTLIRRINGGDILRRMGNRWAGPGRPCGLYQCRDGFVSIIVPRDDQLERLLAVTDLVHLLAEPGIEHAYDLMHHPTLLDDHLRPWFAQQLVAETVELFQAVRVPAAPVSTMADLLDDPHLAARGSLADVDGIRIPGPPARIDSAPWRTEPNADPDTPPADASPAHARPLDGLRVIDLTRVWAGPLATRVLADLGADVVMVEAPWARGGPTIDRASVLATAYYPDNEPGEEHWNRIGFINKYALGKRSISLDLSGEDGRAALAQLLATADVVIENFSPRVMPQLGFDEDRLRAINPELVYVTMPGYGRTGPDRDRVAYGPIVDAHAGLATLMGYPGEPARSAGVAWPDPIAGLHAAAAALAALVNRTAGRDGRVVEVAQIEATVAMVGAALARYQLDGELPSAAGSEEPAFALQAVVPTVGDDRWVAVSVVDADSLDRLGRLIGAESPTAQDLADWTANRDQGAVVATLHADGIAVAAVADAQQVLDDPQLRAKDAWATSDHPAAGTEIWPRTAIRLDGAPLDPARPAPLLGEHNRILVDEAGLPGSSYDALIASGALTTRPPD